jgi:aminoglycoside/choline kinase family phosphotransferase
MTDRSQLLDRLLDEAGWKDAARHPLPSDASFRRYIRLIEDDRRAMLMDAPPPQEDVRPFVHIAERLSLHGYSAPRLLARDIEHGFLLLEDFGDATYTRALAAGADEEALYRGAVDLLIDLHRQDAQALAGDVPPYDEARLQTELALFIDWYLPAVTGKPVASTDSDEYRALWSEALRLAAAMPETLVLRDFHVDNLMLLDRPGIAGVGLLDFQDALKGPTLYDLVSLLRDARRDVSPVLAQSLLLHYLAAFPALDRAAYAAAYACLSVQRNLKILGIFTRLAKRDGKPVYLAHIPRLWRMVEEDVRHPSLAAVARWLDRVVPQELRRIPHGLGA